MAKKIQKKQIEDGVFVETKATYSAPTQDNEFVQKKYVDEEVAKKADISHTHSWTDITNKPHISVTLADTAISRTYTIGLTGANGSSGKLIIPKAVSWNDVTDKPTFPTLPSWVTQTKPTYDWSEIQNKPGIRITPSTNLQGDLVYSLGIEGSTKGDTQITIPKNIDWSSIINKPSFDYLPLTGGTVNGNVNLNGSFLINDKTRVEVRDNGNIVFGNKPFNDLVVGEFKGIQLWGQGNDKVVLAGGGVKNLSDFATAQSVKDAVDNLKIGGRNYVLNSKTKQISVGYVGKYWTLSEPAVVGTQYTFSCYATVESGKQLAVYFTDIAGRARQYILTNLVNGYNHFTIVPNYEWVGICAFHEVAGVSPAPTATIEKLKFEKGNKATDWTPAPEDLIVEKTWEKQRHSLYGESLVTALPSVQREVIIDNGTSKNNLWTDNNELNVGSRNVGGYAKINCNGYKIQGKDSNYLLTADGNSVTKSELLALPRGYDTSTSVVLPATTVNDTVFVKASITLGLENIPNKGSVSFLKTFDGGSVTFICAGKNIIYTGDNSFNGKDGSTATVTIFENKCYIRIANV